MWSSVLGGLVVVGDAGVETVLHTDRSQRARGSDGVLACEDASRGEGFNDARRSSSLVPDAEDMSPKVLLCDMYVVSPETAQ